MKLTPALIRALVAVRGGKVKNVYRADGNVFQGPKGIAPRCYRKLQEARLICDTPRTDSAKLYEPIVQQQITFTGRAALAEHGQ